jgi:hypothetical protein
MKFKERLIRFMYGRNGTDALNRFLIWVYLILILAGYLFKPIHFLAILVAVWMFFRIFSKNLYKRQAENQKYLKIAGKFTGFFKLQKNKFRDRKTHRYRKCPYCRATVRLPNKKGKHTVCCPKCKCDFNVKI